MAGRPLVLGHRGASAAAPENTLEAFARARDLGADGVELDVRRSADGVLVVSHDPEATGVGALHESSFEQIRSVRPDIPTLEEALQECGGMLVNAEVKCLAWEPDADADGTVMRATVDAVRGHRGGVVVSSFELSAVDRAHALAPELTTGWLTFGQPVAKGAPIAADHGHAWLNPDVRCAVAAGAVGMAAVHSAGLRVCVWTVDDPVDAVALAAAGVDVLITNVPDVVLSALP